MDTLQVSRHFTVNVLLNSVGVDLDNENDSFLYDGKGVRISGIVTSHARLYDGHTLMGSGVTWAISESSGVTLMNDGEATENTYPEGVYPTAAWIAPDGTVTVNGMTANTGLIRVRATYGGAYYYHDLTLKRINNGDKYDLLITPSSIPLDPNVTYTTQTLTISATRLNVSGQTYDVTLNSDGIYLAAYYQPDAESSPAWYQASGSFSVTEAIAKNNHNIRFELRKVKSGQTYDKDTPSTYTVEDYETIPIAKDGKNGENSVRLGIDNEHEDFLYDGTTRVAPSSGAVVNARLYDGATEKTTSVTEWRINDTDSDANWNTSTNTNATATINTSTGVMTVTQLIASSARIRVRAKYKDKYYYAEFTANKTNQDKYDIVLTPNSIAFNAATYETQRITVGATGIGIGGTKLSPTISTTANSGNLRVFWATVSINGSGDTVIGTMTRLTTNLYKDVAKAECEANVGIYFELRWYFSASTADSGAESTYRVCDYETVEIAKVTNGAKGDDGANGLYYVEEYARYDSSAANATTGAPTGNIDSSIGWVSIAPAATSGYPFIWKRSRQYNPNTGQYGSYSYVCLNGKSGHVGRFYYFAEEWSSSKTYYFEKNQAPYVLASDGNFYMLDFAAHKDIQESDTTRAVDSEFEPTTHAGGDPWSLMSSKQQYYIAKAFFGDYAQFGSAVINGDYMFSTHGRLFNQDFTNTQSWKGYPAYTYFCGDPVAKDFQKILTNFSIGTSWTSLHNSIYMTDGEMIVLRLYANYLDIPSGGSVLLGLFGTSQQTIQYWNSSASRWDTTQSISITANTEWLIRFTAPSDGYYVMKSKLVSGSVNTVYIYAYLSRMLFNPTWWVDLKTGKNSAAKGKFVADGDSVKVENLFKTVALSWGNAYFRTLGEKGNPTMSIYIRRTGSAATRVDTPMLVAKYGLVQGEYFTLTEEMLISGEFDDSTFNADFDEQDFVACTGLADIVCLLDESDSEWPENGRVCLPRPEDFKGKTIEIRHNVTRGTGRAKITTVTRGADKIAVGPYLNLQSGSSTYRKIVYKSTAAEYSYNAGQIILFYSDGERWVELGRQNAS
jgi:hypothetical protein